MLWKGLKERKNNNDVKKVNNMKIEENNKVVRMTKLLIKINIPGSSGPLRFIVNHNDLVSEVIRSALKLYTRQQRLPLLGSDPNSFLLYSSSLDDFQAMNPWEKIGWYYGTRSFTLLRKKNDDEKKKMISTQNQRRERNLTNWKALFTTKPKSFLLAF